MGVRGRSAAEVEGLLTVSRPCKGFRIAVLVTETAIQSGQSKCTLEEAGPLGVGEGGGHAEDFLLWRCWLSLQQNPEPNLRNVVLGNNR